MKQYKYNKYPNGYLPKIKYWSHQVCLAAQMSPLSHISFCTEKLNYFLNKQKEWDSLYGDAYGKYVANLNK